jgi:hypothetical protein
MLIILNILTNSSTIFIMKIISFLSLTLLLAVITFSCKEQATTENEAPVVNTQDSVFTAMQADAVHNINSYSNAIYQKTQELEAAIAAATGAKKEELSAELEACQTIQTRINEIMLKVSESNPANWEAANEEYVGLRYDVRMALSKTKVNMERAGETAN